MEATVQNRVANGLGNNKYILSLRGGNPEYPAENIGIPY